MIPDMEKIASDWLRTETGKRVVGKPPSSTDSAWVRVTQLDAAEAGNAPVEHLIAYLLQFDCYAGKQGGQPEASALGRTVRAALIDLPGTHDGVVVSSVRIVGHARVPDTDLDEPARERMILTARIHAHA